MRAANIKGPRITCHTDYTSPFLWDQLPCGARACGWRALPFTLKSDGGRKRTTALRSGNDRAEVAGALGCGPRSLCGRAGHEQQTEILRAGNAAVSQRATAHGPRAQLRHWR